MSCDPPMNQKEIIASISLYTKNASSLATIMNIYLYPAFSNVCVIYSYHNNKRLVMFLPNIYTERIQSNRKAMNRNWSNHKTDPALKTIAGNK